MHINYISKLEFFCSFCEAFFALMTEKNVQGSFADIGLVLYNPERVLFKLDVKLYILMPLNLQAGTPQS